MCPENFRNIYEDLEYRGLIHQQSDAEALSNLLADEKVGVYAGFDPTADSLHIGNLVPLIALKRFQEYGHHAIALVGGGTGLIGDPSGKKAERTLNTSDTVVAWTASVRRQLERFLDFNAPGNPARLVNNYDWISSLSAIELLRDVGKHFTVNWMIAKESVRARFEEESRGISYTEFSYMILQAYDFLHLCENYNCVLQVGGSDQWGNIIAGIELIRRKTSKQGYAMTFPLIMTASGTKFGKTESGTIWLDPARTTPYDFYQFWMNTDDRDVVRFLRYFTFLDRPKIDDLERAVTERPERREGQRALAEHMTALVHGESEAKKATAASLALFGSGDLREVDETTLQNALASAPQIAYERLSDVPDPVSLLVDSGLCSSKSDARRVVKSGGLYLNNERFSEADNVVRPEQFLFGKFLLLRKGKKDYALVRLKIPTNV